MVLFALVLAKTGVTMIGVCGWPPWLTPGCTVRSTSVANVAGVALGGGRRIDGVLRRHHLVEEEYVPEVEEGRERREDWGDAGHAVEALVKALDDVGDEVRVRHRSGRRLLQVEVLGAGNYETPQRGISLCTSCTHSHV